MKFSFLSIRRSMSLLLALAAVSGVVTLAVNGSEPTDSGWAVSRPETVVFETKSSENAQVRIAINHVLGQSQSPLLLQGPTQNPVAMEASLEKAGDAPTAESPDPKLPIVFGNAGVSADGWRPAHLPTSAPKAAPNSGAASTLEGRHFSSAASTPDTSATQSDAQSAESAPATETQTKTSAAPAAAPVVKSTEELADELDGDAESIVDTPNATSDTTPNVAADKSTVDSKTVESRIESNAQSADATPKPAPVVVKPPAPPLPPLTQNQKNLRAKVRRVIKSYYTRPLNSRENDPWELMHGMLAYGVKSQIRQGGPQGNTITLVGWMCYNRPSKGFTLLYLTPENELRAKQGVGLQGHMGQFLAMLAQCQVSPEYPIRVRDKEFTIKDLIEAEKVTCYPKSELTFKLIALMHYLDSNETWVNDQGQSWDIPRLIREELAQPIRGAACGGTHRLSGLSLAARTRVQRGEPLDGEYLRAAQFVDKYQNYAFQLQNRDGSLSTEWFRGRGEEDDTDRRVKTTGHILEWLCYSLPDQDVRSAKTFRAANYLATLLATNFNHEWEVGPLGHAIHALRLYDERVFQPYDGLEEVAKKPARKTAKRPSTSSRSRTMSY